MVVSAPVFTLSAHIYAGLIPIDAAAFLLKHSHRQPGVCNLNNIGAVFLAVRHYICHRLAEVLLVGSARLCFPSTVTVMPSGMVNVGFSLKSNR